MRQRVLLCASIVAFTLAALPAGLAQPVPPPYPGTVYPGEGMMLPPYEVAAIETQTAKPDPGAKAPQDGAKETKSNETTGTVTAPANPAATPAEQYDYE